MKSAPSNKRSRLKVSLLAAATVLAIPTGHAAELRHASGQKISGQYIVVLKDDAAALSNERTARPRPKAAAVAQEMARAHGAQLKHAYSTVLRGFAVKANAASLKKLLADPRVAYVEEDGVVYADATQSNATWGIDRVDQRDRPLSGSYTYDTTASSVHAYIIDTGMRLTHSEFSGRVGNGYDAVTSGGNASDCNGHGTHVAGTVGGTTWGIAKGVKLHPVRVLGCNGSGSNSGVIAGMDWVANNHISPAVANMSLGGGADTATDDAVARLTASGVTVAVAAGNDNDNACNYSPARASSAITVGSTTSSDARSSFSNYGSCVDIFAPGSSITSASYGSDTGSTSMSGTSMASPHVAGVAALYLATNPTATPAQVANALASNASTNKVTDPVGSPNRLLYSLSGGAPACNSTGGTLGNGVASGNLCGATGAQLRFTLTVPAGASGLKFVTSGGSGDADLYVKFGSQPSTTAYDCKSDGSTTAETCNIASAQAGTYYVLLSAYATFSGTSLTGSYSAGGGGTVSGSNTNNYTIGDNTTVESPIAISATGAGSSSAQVSVDIKHAYRGDLRIDLVAPDGTTYLLKNYSSSDSADNVLATYSVNLSTEQRNGTWKLRISDNAANDTGYIDSWVLSL
ncbi:S8 family serine peptidase [Lysobacter fragariae]